MTSPPGPQQPDNPSDTPPESNETYRQIHSSEDFQRLRRQFRRFVFPMSISFLVWYTLYVAASAYARDLLAIEVVGNINVALIWGLLQFVSTFLIAWAYARYANRHLDPVVERVRAAHAASTKGDTA